MEAVGEVWRLRRAPMPTLPHTQPLETLALVMLQPTEERRQGPFIHTASLLGPGLVSRALARWPHPRNLVQNIPGG